MSVVLSLVGPGSDDFSLASKELEALQTKRAQTQSQQGSTNLTTPESQVPTDPSLDPQLELPEEAEPPQPNEELEQSEPTEEPEPTLNPDPLP